VREGGCGSRRVQASAVVVAVRGLDETIETVVGHGEQGV
jgi:hypothetical protein